MCGDCFDGRKRIATRAAKEKEAAEDLLEAYALPGLGLDR